MTATAKRQVSFRSPAAGIAAIPYLLSFTPENSLVVMWLSDTKELIVTQRMDLPEDLSAEYLSSWYHASFGHSAAEEAYAASFVFVCSLEEDSDMLVDACLKEFDDSRISSILITDFTSWREYGSRTTHPISAEDAAYAAAALGYSSAERPAGKRSTVEETFAPHDTINDSIVERAIEKYEAAVEDGKSLEQWLKQFADNVSHLLAGHRLTDTALAEILIALQDSRLRDAFVTLVAEHKSQYKLDILVKLVARAPEELKAPIATVAGIAAYLKGDGLRANIATDVALAADSKYQLAELLHSMILKGVPPVMLRESILSPE